MRTRRVFGVLALSTLAFLLGARPVGAGARDLAGTVDLLLDLDVRPFAIAHRGFGENLGADPSRPIEDTVPAVRQGFMAGASVVEVDVQLTRDGEVAVFHDDFLDDLTCLNRLTLSELQRRLPYVPSLQAVLNQARRVNQASGPLRGILIVELKAAAPLCDPDDSQEHAIVSAVTRVIRHMRMTDQVLLTSFSPALLYLARAEAPEIARILAVSGLQFLTKEQIEARLKMPVTLIHKQLDLGLPWAELGRIFRLPGYPSVGDLVTTATITGARVVEADLFLLSFTGAALVGILHDAGLKVFGFTANTDTEWAFLQSLDVDGIYTNDVPLGVRRQAPIP